MALGRGVIVAVAVGRGVRPGAAVGVLDACGVADVAVGLVAGLGMDRSRLTWPALLRAISRSVPPAGAARVPFAATAAPPSSTWSAPRTCHATCVRPSARTTLNRTMRGRVIPGVAVGLANAWPGDCSERIFPPALWRGRVRRAWTAPARLLARST